MVEIEVNSRWKKILWVVIGAFLVLCIIMYTVTSLYFTPRKSDDHHKTPHQSDTGEVSEGKASGRYLVIPSGGHCD